MLICLMIFLVGVGVQDSAIDNKNETGHFITPNRIYLYFISGSIFLVIGIVFKSNDRYLLSIEKDNCHCLAVSV
jgi:hypothetical protein